MNRITTPFAVLFHLIMVVPGLVYGAPQNESVPDSYCKRTAFRTSDAGPYEAVHRSQDAKRF